MKRLQNASTPIGAVGPPVAGRARLVGGWYGGVFNGVFAGRPVIGTALHNLGAPPPIPPIPSYRLFDEDYDFCPDVDELCEQCRPMRLSCAETLFAEVLPGLTADTFPQVLEHVRDHGKVQELFDCAFADPRDEDVGQWLYGKSIVPTGHDAPTTSPLAAHGFVLPMTTFERPHPFDDDSTFPLWRLCCFSSMVRRALGLEPGVVTDTEYVELLALAIEKQDELTLRALVDAMHIFERPLIDLNPLVMRCTNFNMEEYDHIHMFVTRIALVANTTSYCNVGDKHSYFVRNTVHALLCASRHATLAEMLSRWSVFERSFYNFWQEEERDSIDPEVFANTLKSFACLKNWQLLGELVHSLKFYRRVDRHWPLLLVHAGRAMATLIRAAPALAAVRKWHQKQSAMLSWQERVQLFAPTRIGGKRLREEYAVDFGHC